jgi:hypothetical protein
VYVRDAQGERRRHEQVTLRFPRDEAVVEREDGTVRLLTATEEGTAGSLAVIVLNGRGDELARGLYQVSDTLADQFGGGHGFTGLVIWRDPATGAEVQFYCAA